ncbi:MFS transporter [Nocardia neocaledoniensis NBRC 108232]|uniref:DHA1 family inner membrane transport protein n=1 Tax=Nocardia neocaledoniensis TaxID=236511 RepID=A0A317N986_9NOCA|nr:MFS transporter [Nocardia neocaledoniensis]PWV71765.1 DHA1 family inner membrane transport protein [Nocardia neocaledoniensis]GEM33063.1 MFS transporter [Nocardia neocaledoniensis NBRC 108232]
MTTLSTAPPRARTAHEPEYALGALALGAFGIGLTEFVLVGLLGVIGDDLSISVPSAGLLVTGYAAGVAVGAPLMTALGARVPRKTMLASLLGIFVAGNLLSAVAPNYELLLAGRIVAALTHGAFFGIGAVVAADLVAPQRRAGAIATMFTGLTLANVAGVPLGTALGQAFGWRSTFWAVTAVGVAALAAVLALVPPQPREFVDFRAQLAVFARVQVWSALLITALGFGAVFAVFTFFEPILTEVTGLPDAAVPWLLVVFGVGLFGGNLIGGRLADRAVLPTLIGALAALTVVLVIFAAVAAHPVGATVTILALGATGFAIVPAVQMRVLDTAGRASTLGSAANISAFNVGIAAASWLGSAAIDRGLGLTAPAWIGAGLAAAALVVTLVSRALDGRG